MFREKLKTGVALAIVGLATVSAFDLFPTSPQTERRLPWAATVIAPERASGFFYCLPIPGSAISGYREPATADIVDADALLEQLTESIWTCRPPRPWASSLRQYLAVSLHGRQKLYVNGLPQSVLDDPMDWRNESVSIDDGGPRFWHAIIDVADGRIELVKTDNGYAEAGITCAPPRVLVHGWHVAAALAVVFACAAFAVGVKVGGPHRA